MPVVRVFVNSIFVLLPDEGLLYIVFLSLLPDGELEGNSILSKKKGFIEWSLSLRAISLCNNLILYACWLPPRLTIATVKFVSWGVQGVSCFPIG